MSPQHVHIAVRWDEMPYTQHSPEQLEDDGGIAEHPVNRLEGKHGRPGNTAAVTSVVDRSEPYRPISLALASYGIVCWLRRNQKSQNETSQHERRGYAEGMT